MSGGANIRAGRAYVELTARDRMTGVLKSVEARMRRFSTALTTVGSKMMIAGAAIVAPMIGAAKFFANTGDEIGKMAKRTGFTVEALSALRFAAQQTGTEFASLENGVKKMQRSIYDLGRGLSTSIDAFADLGLTQQDLANKSPEQQFLLVGQRLGAVEDATTRAGISMQIFGRTGTNLLPMFAQGAEGINKLMKEAQQLGLVMSTENATAAEDFKDEISRLGDVLKMTVFEIGAAVAGPLTDFSEWLRAIVPGVRDWISENKKLIGTVLKIGAGVLAVGAGLYVLGKVFGIVAAAVKIATVIMATYAAVQALANPVKALLGVAAAAAVAATAIGIMSVGSRDAADQAAEAARAHQEAAQAMQKASREKGPGGTVIDADLAGLQKRKALELDWERKVKIAKLQAIDDEHERGVALLNERYDHEIARAKEVGATKKVVDLMERKRRLDLDALEKRLSGRKGADAKGLIDSLVARAGAAMDSVLLSKKIFQGGVQGTFSGNFSQMQGGVTQQGMSDAMTRTADNTAKLVRQGEGRGGGLRFS